MITNFHSTNKFAGFRKPVKALKRACIAFACVLCFAGSAYSQQNYRYRFQLQGITDPAAAKMVTDILRPVFNTSDDAYAVFPEFNDALDQFDFFSPVVVTEQQLTGALVPHGILLISFSNVNDVSPEVEER